MMASVWSCTRTIFKWGLQVYVVTTTCFYVAGFGSYYGAHTILTLPRPALQFTLGIVLHQCDKPTNVVRAATSYHLYTDFTGYDLAVTLLQLCCHVTVDVQQNTKSCQKPYHKTSDEEKTSCHGILQKWKQPCVGTGRWNVFVLSIWCNSQTEKKMAKNMRKK
jgi:hypothetical protein